MNLQALGFNVSKLHAVPSGSPWLGADRQKDAGGGDSTLNSSVIPAGVHGRDSGEGFLEEGTLNGGLKLRAGLERAGPGRGGTHQRPDR